jgi:MFS family permease
MKKEHVKAYATTFGLYYWLALSAIYIPIFIIGVGMDSYIVGYVLGAGILPLIFMEEWAGSLSDKKGMKFFLMFGFILLGLACFLLGLGLAPVLMISIMVLSNIGAGIIEPIQEKYFFTVIDKSDESKYYGVRLTSQSLAGIVAPAIAGISLMVFGKSAIWLSAAAIMIIMVFVSLSIKK